MKETRISDAQVVILGKAAKAENTRLKCLLTRRNLEMHAICACSEKNDGRTAEAAAR